MRTITCGGIDISVYGSKERPQVLTKKTTGYRRLCEANVPGEMDIRTTAIRRPIDNASGAISGTAIPE